MGWRAVERWSGGLRSCYRERRQLIEKTAEDFFTCAGDVVSGAGTASAKGEEEDERNPPAGILLEALTEGVEGARNFDGQLNTGDGVNRGVAAEFRGGGDEVFAAAEGTDGMDAATLVFEKRARDASVEIVDGQLGGRLATGDPFLVEDFVDDASIAQGDEGAMESLLERGAAVVGQGADPLGEGFGFEETDGDKLTAAGTAAGSAGDGSAGGIGFLGDAGDDCVLQVLQDGEELGEGGRPGGNGGADVEKSVSDRQ